MKTIIYTKSDLIRKFKKACPYTELSEYNLASFAAYNGYKPQIEESYRCKELSYAKTYYQYQSMMIPTPCLMLETISNAAYKLFGTLYRLIAMRGETIDSAIVLTMGDFMKSVSSNKGVIKRAIDELEQAGLIKVTVIHIRKRAFAINWDHEMFDIVGASRILNRDKRIIPETTMIARFVRDHPGVEPTQNRVTRYAKQHMYSLVTKIIDGSTNQFYVDLIF